MIHLLLAIIYLSFISLGLPDALLGAGWPTMYLELGVPVSYMGIVSMIIAAGTVVSSLQSDRLTKRLGTGRVTAISVGLTAVALLGFSGSHSFWQLCLWAIPYGLGAGSVDAALNNYVALHYASRHMSWLHCMWGVGVSIGPWFMTLALTGGRGWNGGYRYVALLQAGLTLLLIASLKLWQKPAAGGGTEKSPERPLKLAEVLRIPGAKEVMLTFFCYCALEQTAGQWASSYLVMKDGLTAEQAAAAASLFYLGITGGRAISGFLTIKWKDSRMIRVGMAVLALGILVMLLPLGAGADKAGLVLAGLGCAPIYPCVIHSTPEHFGADRSQAVIGVQMASAYVGTCLMPPVCGLITERLGAGLLPAVLLAFWGLMVLMHERLNRICRSSESRD